MEQQRQSPGGSEYSDQPMKNPGYNWPMRKKLHLKNNHGFTLIELLVAMVIAIVVLGVTISYFTKQQSLIQDENDGTKVRAKGRHAIKMIAREVRMAGYGLPPNEAISGYAVGPGAMVDIDSEDVVSPLPATANSLRFRLNLDNVRTSMVSTGGDISGTSIPVYNGSGFQGNDAIVIYNPVDDVREYTTVTGSSAGAINVSGLTETYSFGEYARHVMINKFNEYTIQLDGVNRRIVRVTDGGALVPLVNNVDLAAQDGLVFNFLEKTGDPAEFLATLDRIEIILNMIDPNNPNASIEFKTEVQIRNS
jgi:prepilin-type N-terminal cleavage/methylation domain-containing protein